MNNYEEENDYNNDEDGTVNSDCNREADSTTSSSSRSRRSRSSKKSEKAMQQQRHSFPSFDPMHVVTKEQLEAFSLLVSTPIWIFDFIQKKNRYSNRAGLELWSSPDLEEFQSRPADMSAATAARTQELQSRIERGQIVQDMWTFYPKGKAATIPLTMTAVRLSPDEDHCSIFVVANMMISSSTTNSSFDSSGSKSSSSSNTVSGGAMINTVNSDIITKMDTTHTAKDVKTTHDNVVDSTTGRGESEKTAADCDENEMEKEDYSEHYDNDAVPMNHHIATMEDDSPVKDDILRGVEIIRHLPMAVCQFDMKGRVMFQNPAAYLPPLQGDELNKGEEKEDYTASTMDGMETDDEGSEFNDHLSEFGGIQTLSSNNRRGNFLDRFVNKTVAIDLLQRLQDKPKQQIPSSIPPDETSSIDAATFHHSNNTATISVEGELYTSTKGRTQWSAIQLRKTTDPVTSKQVILYCALDKSDAMEAKREREARLQKSEFLAIMAHEIRTPLHQVTGFIDLLELDACSNTNINTANSRRHGTVSSSISHNALFPTRTDQHGRPTSVRKCQSTSLIDASTTVQSPWHSILNRRTIGNLTEEQKGYIKLLKSSANQLMTVISDVLDYSKLEAGKMKTESIPFELLSVVQGSMEAVRGSCEEKGLALTLEYGGSDDNDEEDNGDKTKSCRRRNCDGIAHNDSPSRPPQRRKIGNNHSFNNRSKNKFDSEPNIIKSNDIPYRIIGDPNRLRQVLLNLLSNAVKFTEVGSIHIQVSSTARPVSSLDAVETVAGATYNISTKNNDDSTAFIRSPSSLSINERKDEGNKATEGSGCIDKANAKLRFLRIKVTDTGIGINKQNQSTIFEKYTQANLSVARNFGGTGLGLSICKLLVEATMGGTIGVISDAGRGSSFHVTLPIIEALNEKIDDTTGVDGYGGNQKSNKSMHILVAEDNKINQKVVANMLKRMGHRSTLVENGRQAIDMIEKKNSKRSSSGGLCYDAVLMDIQMPVMDGLEATRRLRTMGYSDLPILGLTASVKRSDYEELGFDDWLPKPILMKDLKAKLHKLIYEDSVDNFA